VGAVPRARIVTDAEQARALADGWDALAVAAGRPYCAPAWMLAWWRHVEPPRSELCVVAVEDGDELVGLAPCYVISDTGLPVLRMLGAGFNAGLEPLAVAGREGEVAEAIAGALAVREERLAVLSLEGLPGGRPWPGLLAMRWPGRTGAKLSPSFAMPAPYIDLSEGGYAGWLERRSSKTRAQLRRSRRGLEQAGATLRLAETDEHERVVPELMRLYRGRFEGSERLAPPVERMLIEAGAELGPAGRYLLWVLESEQGIVGANLVLRAGDTTSGWGGGFDEAWARHSPSMGIVAASVEHAAANGVRRMDMGEGAPPWKLRLADGDAGLQWALVFPRGRRYVQARLWAAPRSGRRWLVRQAKRLPPDARERLKHVLRRG
jgi:CelD/BcsL family acetyltransferase involved in cellulose biosynthesis